jgi:phage FluMu protein Com
MTTYRCIACNKVLFEAELIEGTIKKICKCGCVNTVKSEHKISRVTLADSIQHK